MSSPGLASSSLIIDDKPKKCLTIPSKFTYTKTNLTVNLRNVKLPTETSDPDDMFDYETLFHYSNLILENYSNEEYDVKIGLFKNRNEYGPKNIKVDIYLHPFIFEREWHLAIGFVKYEKILLMHCSDYEYQNSYTKTSSKSNTNDTNDDIDDHKDKPSFDDSTVRVLNDFISFFKHKISRHALKYPRLYTHNFQPSTPYNSINLLTVIFAFCLNPEAVMSNFCDPNVEPQVFKLDDCQSILDTMDADFREHLSLIYEEKLRIEDEKRRNLRIAKQKTKQQKSRLETNNKEEIASSKTSLLHNADKKNVLIDREAKRNNDLFEREKAKEIAELARQGNLSPVKSIEHGKPNAADLLKEAAILAVREREEKKRLEEQRHIVSPRQESIKKEKPVNERSIGTEKKKLQHAVAGESPWKSPLPLNQEEREIDEKQKALRKRIIEEEARVKWETELREMKEQQKAEEKKRLEQRKREQENVFQQIKQKKELESQEKERLRESKKIEQLAQNQIKAGYEINTQPESNKEQTAKVTEPINLKRSAKTDDNDLSEKRQKLDSDVANKENIPIDGFSDLEDIEDEDDETDSKQKDEPAKPTQVNTSTLLNKTKDEDKLRLSKEKMAFSEKYSKTFEQFIKGTNLFANNNKIDLMYKFINELSNYALSNDEFEKTHDKSSIEVTKSLYIIYQQRRKQEFNESKCSKLFETKSKNLIVPLIFEGGSIFLVNIKTNDNFNALVNLVCITNRSSRSKAELLKVYAFRRLIEIYVEKTERWISSIRTSVIPLAEESSYKLTMASFFILHKCLLLNKMDMMLHPGRNVFETYTLYFDKMMNSMNKYDLLNCNRYFKRLIEQLQRRDKVISALK